MKNASQIVFESFKQSGLFKDLYREIMKYKKKASIEQCNDFLLSKKELSDPKSKKLIAQFNFNKKNN